MPDEAAVIREVVDILEETGERSGHVFYSESYTLRPGKLYLVGINPGGTPYPGEEAAKIKNNVFLASGKAHLAEAWNSKKNYATGKHPIQRKLKGVVDELSLGIVFRDVTASNIIFVRSETVNAVSEQEFLRLAVQSWAIHKWVIKELVQPEVILCNGTGTKSAYGYLKHKLTGRTAEASFLSGHGDTRCYSFSGNVGDPPAQGHWHSPCRDFQHL